MVYISCKPTSLARDLEVFEAAGYKVMRAATAVESVHRNYSFISRGMVLITKGQYLKISWNLSGFVKAFVVLRKIM